MKVGITRFEVGYMCYHVCEERVGCYVERHTQSHIRRALVQLLERGQLKEWSIKPNIKIRTFIRFILYRPS